MHVCIILLLLLLLFLLYIQFVREITENNRIAFIAKLIYNKHYVIEVGTFFVTTYFDII
jgi:hypothetical protein